MPSPFLIRNAQTGVEFELSDPAYFLEHYKPQGFAIVDPAPHGYTVPALPGDAVVVETEGDPELDFGKMSRDELNAYAASVGVESPDALPNKGAVIDAIQDLASGDGGAS